MMPHGGMTIETKRLAVQPRAGEKISEYAESLEDWCSNHKRDDPVLKSLAGDIDGAADAADLRRRVERGARFVVDDLWLKSLQRPKDFWQRCIHVGGRHRAAAAGAADRADVWVSPQSFIAGRGSEPHG